MTDKTLYRWLDWPWLDRSGKLSPFKLAVFLALFAPGAWTLYGYVQGTLGPRPLIEAIHQIGLWAIRFLMIALAITPLRLVLHWPKLILVRRMTGVAAFAYALLHLAIYIVDQGFDLGMVVSEIALRFYLTIGFATLLCLSVLAATSTDGMIRRLGGRRWRRLHRLVYPLAVLGLVHYFIQSKLAVQEPLAIAGLFAWLMGWRAIGWIRGGDRAPSLAALLGLSLAAGALTGLGEALYYRLANHFDFMRILSANLTWHVERRPGWVVLLICLAVMLIGALRSRAAAKRRPKPVPSPASAAAAAPSARAA
jgi:methionine sulfoxide reductase heme-binding subunit